MLSTRLGRVSWAKPRGEFNGTPLVELQCLEHLQDSLDDGSRNEIISFLDNGPTLRESADKSLACFLWRSCPSCLILIVETPPFG